MTILQCCLSHTLTFKVSQSLRSDSLSVINPAVACGWQAGGLLTLLPSQTSVCPIWLSGFHWVLRVTQGVYQGSNIRYVSTKLNTLSH